MPRYVAMLRAVNVGGRGRLSMPDLRAAVESLGHTRVETYVQSGNVAFTSRTASPDRIAAAVRERLVERCGIHTAVLVRSRADLAAVLAAGPFVPAGADPATVHVTFLLGRPAPDAVAALAPFDVAPDRFVVLGSEVHLWCPGGYGRTKLTNTFFERHLHTVATTRSWRSVTALCALA